MHRNASAHAAAAGSAADFAAAVDHLLEKTETLIEVRHSTQVESGALKQLLAMMARKIQLQEHTIDRQSDAIAALQAEVARLRVDGEVAQNVLVEVRKVSRDVDEQRATLNRQSQAVQSMREEHETMHYDIARAVAAAADASAAVATAHRPPPPPQVTAFDIPRTTFAAATATPQRRPFFAAASLRATAAGEPEGGAAEYTPEPEADHTTYQRRHTSAAYNVAMTPPPENQVAPIGAPPPPPPHLTPNATARSRSHVDDSVSRYVLAKPPSSQRPLAGIDLTDTLTGAKISAVKPGGPGHIAGLQIGDTVVRFNGKDVKSKHDFVSVLNRCVPGQCVDVAHRKEGHAIVVTKVVLGAATTPLKA
jgi:hypothetical protein